MLTWVKSMSWPRPLCFISLFYIIKNKKNIWQISRKVNEGDEIEKELLIYLKKVNEGDEIENNFLSILKKVSEGDEKNKQNKNIAGKKKFTSWNELVFSKCFFNLSKLTGF